MIPKTLTPSPSPTLELPCEAAVPPPAQAWRPPATPESPTGRSVGGPLALRLQRSARGGAGRALAALMALVGLAQSAPAAPALSAFAALPLSFEPAAPENGLAGAYLARGLNYQFLISPTEAQLVLCKSTHPTIEGSLDRAQLLSSRLDSARVVRMAFLGANLKADASGDRRLPGKVNYLLGDDPSRWRVGAPTFAQVRVDQLYPGIDLVYYGNQQQLEYDFTIAPGADPAVIALRFEGVDRLTVNDQGDLVLGIGADEIRQPRPTVFQVARGQRQPVLGGYRLQDSHTITFEPGVYDHRLPLTIDPTLTYSSYFGGNGNDIAWAVKVSTNGIYLAGQTLSAQFPFSGPGGLGGLTNHGGRYNGDGFVAKLDPTGTKMLFFTYLGGAQDDSVLDLALDSADHAYVTGYTGSTNFPVVAGGGGWPGSVRIGGVLTPARLYYSDAFVAELTPDGSALVFSGYLGGSDRDSGIGICLDASNYVYVTGYTYSTNFPTTNALVVTRPGTTDLFACNQRSGSNDVFVTKLAPGGAGMVYSTYLGGTNFDVGQGIAADNAGNAFITGYTSSTNFPVTAALAPFTGQLNNTTNAASKYHGRRVPPYDAFVAKIAPQGSNLLYSVLLGGTNNDSGFRIKLDPAGDAYVCGSSYSAEFPIIPSVMTNLYSPGITNRVYVNSDAFLTKIVESTNGPSIEYSVHFGGTGNEIAWDLAINPVTTNIFVVGSTLSTNFTLFVNSSTNFPFLPLTNHIRSNDVFVAAFAPIPYVVTTPLYVISNDTIIDTVYLTTTNNILTNLYAVCMGGMRDDFGFGIDVNPGNDAYIVGQTVSADFPLLTPLQPGMAGVSDAFLAKIQFADSLASVVVDTRPPNLQVIIDGVSYTAPYTTNWVIGSIHSIFTPGVQANAPGSQAIWTSWSNGGAISNLVVPAASSLAYTATFSTQYLLTMNAAGVGLVDPPTGWYDAGSVVTLTATPAAGATFTGWTASGPGASGAANPTTVTLSGPITQTAYFSGELTDQVVVIAKGPGTVSPDYAGQTLVPGKTYTLTATPAANYVFSGWTGSLSASTPRISFVMTTGLVFQASFATNVFLSSKGTYTGLFYDTNNFAYQSSGSFSASVSDSGAFSASFRVANHGYSCSGSFVNGGFATIISRGSLLLPLQVNLMLDTNGPGRITGLISGYTWTGQIEAERAAYSNTSPAPQANRTFTLRIPQIPGLTNSLVEPGGDGFATIAVTAAGKVSVSGALGDGARFTQSSALSAGDQWPLYASLYASRGLVLGWLSFTNQPASQPGGELSWYRPAKFGAKFYPSGFTLQPATAGSPYAFANGSSVLNLTSGRIIIAGGGLLRNITNAFSLAGAKFTPAASANKLTLSVTSSSGLFSGSFYDPDSRRTFSISGALFQSQTNGAGFFQTTNQTGRVLITP